SLLKPSFKQAASGGRRASSGLQVMGDEHTGQAEVVKYRVGRRAVRSWVEGAAKYGFTSRPGRPDASSKAKYTPANCLTVHPSITCKQERAHIRVCGRIYRQTFGGCRRVLRYSLFLPSTFR